jgi:hypothetical protein
MLDRDEGGGGSELVRWANQRTVSECVREYGNHHIYTNARLSGIFWAGDEEKREAHLDLVRLAYNIK